VSFQAAATGFEASAFDLPDKATAAQGGAYALPVEAGVRALIIQMPAPLDTMTLERFAVDIRSRLRVDA